MNKTIRWGVIGCGNVTELKSTPAFQKVEGFDVACVMGRNESKIKDYAARHHVPSYTTDLGSLLQQVDAVYIATPPDTHVSYALEVLQAKLPCCIEKPISHDTRSATQVVNAFKAENIPLFVSYYRRSLPRFLKIKEWLLEEKIGTIRHVSWDFHKPANDLDINGIENWRTDKEIAVGGYFEDLASHGLDLFNYLFGAVQKASGIAINQQGIYSAKDSVAGCWLHPGNITGSGYWNFGSYERMDRVEIIGDKGKITFSVFLENPLELKTSETDVKEWIGNPENIQFYHAENMKAHLLNGEQHPSTGETALHANWVMDQILGKNN